MLRSCIDPLEMFYIQPYVQDLHRTIQILYQKQKKIDDFK